MSDIPGYEKLLKMQQDPENQTPMQKEYNKLTADDGRLTQAVLMQMRQMIAKQINPNWEGFSKTKTWMVLSMNITEANRKRYQARWHELYTQLLGVQSNENLLAVPEQQPTPVHDGDGDAD